MLPVHILLSGIGAINGIVSSYFASNYVGVDAMSAVGLYSPFNMLFTAISVMITGGATLLCGMYMGKNDREELQNTFSISILLSVLIAAIFTCAFLLAGVLDATGILVADPAVRPLFNRYLVGQAVGVLPLLLGSQLSAYLTLENKERITFTASLVYIAANVLLNQVFVKMLHLEALGLALASALGLWIFLGVQASYFLSGRSFFRLQHKKLRWAAAGEVLKIGAGGAASNAFQTLRGFWLNHLMSVYIGSVAISAFATADNLLRIFWAVPQGMQAITRVLIGISVGEEDRQTLTDIMWVAVQRFFPIECVIAAGLFLFAEPLTSLFYQDPSSAVFQMTAQGFRILPMAMPLSLLYMVYVCFGQAAGKHALVHLLAFLDGVFWVIVYASLRLPAGDGIAAAYGASVFNGVMVLLTILGYAVLKLRHFPRSMEELLVLPPDFGVPKEQRMDLSVERMEQVVEVSRQIQDFCQDRGIDGRRAYLAGLAMEEMAGNIVKHGFSKDKKKHSVDVRVAHKGEGIFLRMRDDCIPFDPGERLALMGEEDRTKNIGLRMVFAMAEDIGYQSMLGQNVLTVRLSPAERKRNGPSPSHTRTGWFSSATTDPPDLLFSGLPASSPEGGNFFQLFL